MILNFTVQLDVGRGLSAGRDLAGHNLGDWEGKRRRSVFLERPDDVSLRDNTGDATTGSGDDQRANVPLS